MSLHAEYHNLPDGQEIKFSVYYTKGRGYWVSFVPVKKYKSGDFMMEEIAVFSGFKDTLLEADRQSEKRKQVAISILKQRIDKYLEKFATPEQVN